MFQCVLEPGSSATDVNYTCVVTLIIICMFIDLGTLGVQTKTYMNALKENIFI